MDRGNDSSLAAFLLVNRLEKAGAPPLTVGEYWQVVRSIDDPAWLLKKSSKEISETTGAPEDLAVRVQSLLSHGRGAALSLEELEQSGIRAITPFDDSYPERLQMQLRDAAPPLLFYAGEPSLLSASSLAIVGSRRVGHEELDVARHAAASAVKRGIGVISGGARGVDQVAMATAFAEDGIVTGVLADSLIKNLREPDTRRAILDGRAIFLSHQNPGAGFSVGAAMGRNKIVYALAELTFVVTAAVKSGGTWTGADEALRRKYGHVAVWMGEGRRPGNELLVEQGATPVSDLEELFDLEPRAVDITTEDEVADQLHLGL